ncbi:MAG: plastocyanin/azurin family copper-binding protein, partial [Ktedonobacterales bacterium]
MRKLAGVLLLCVAFTLAACGGTASTGSSNPTATTPPAATDTPAPPTATVPPSAATITMGRSSFSGNTSVTIKAGQAVLFSDPASNGGTHDLVIGHNGQFSAMSGAPSEFNSATGTAFSPGDQTVVTFATAGTYPITCSIHPFMQV